MKISCPSCSAKYSIADEKVQNKLAKIRCRKCGTTIVIDGKSSPPTVQTGESATTGSTPPVAAGLYTVDLSENDQPQMTVAQIVEAYNTGSLTAETYVWAEGMADWEALGQVPEINDALHRAAAQHAEATTAQSDGPAAPAVATSSLGAAASDAFGGAPERAPDVTAPLEAAADISARAATKAAASRGASYDLFGGIDAAGGEDDVTTSAAQAPAVGAAGTGARNESSVLFSLSALTASDPSPAASTAQSSNQEDSGLIDLAALTSGASGGGAGQAAAALDLGAAPLGVAPLGVPAQAAPQEKSGKGVMILGASVVGAAVASVAMFFAMSEEPPPPIPSAALTAPSIAQSAAAATGATAPEASAAASASASDVAAAGATGSASAEASASAAEAEKAAPPKKYTPPPKKYTPPKSAAPAEQSSTTKKKKKKVKKKSSCNCKPSDLMCAMRCSAK